MHKKAVHKNLCRTSNYGEKLKIFYNNDYTCSTYAFDTTRKSAAIAQYLSVVDNPNVTITDPSDFYAKTEDLIRIVHRAGYVNAVKTGEPLFLAESQGFTWDENIYHMAVAHNAGLVAATDEVLSGRSKTAGSLSSGLHHADTQGGAGFCTFNGLAAAANAAFLHGATRILCIDFDAHCGGGTYEATRPINMVQVDLSTNSFDKYIPVSSDTESRCTIMPAARANNDDLYLTNVFSILEYVESLPKFDFIMYNAGMDPYNDGIAYETLIERENIVAKWIAEQNTPAIFAMAGGYTWGGVTMGELAELHGHTVITFASQVFANAS